MVAWASQGYGSLYSKHYKRRRMAQPMAMSTMHVARRQRTLKPQLGGLGAWSSFSLRFQTGGRLLLCLRISLGCCMLQHTPLAGVQLCCACGCMIPRRRNCPYLHESITFLDKRRIS